MTPRRRIGRARSVPAVLLVLTALSGLAACGEAEPSAVRLRFTYIEDDTLRYEYTSSGTYTIPDTAGGTTQQTYERAMRIEEVAEDVSPTGNYHLAVTYHVEPDTAAGTRVPAPVTIRLEMTPQGKIIDVTGVETAGAIFGDIDFRSYFEQAQPVFPDRPLKPGDSWTQEVRVVGSGPEPVTTSSTYVLQALDEEDGEAVATVAFDGEIYLPIGHDAAENGGLGEERIRVHGTFTFAPERGVMRRVETDARATVTKVSVEGGQAYRRDVQIQERSRIRLTDR